MRVNMKKGFTLIELLIVIVIIGILAAIAIPKFAATKDKAKLASVKTDIRNYMTSEEAYFSDNQTYGDDAALTAAGVANLSAGNAFTASAATAGGYSVTITNSSISTGQTNACHVDVGQAAASSAVDGKIICP